MSKTEMWPQTDSGLKYGKKIGHIVFSVPLPHVYKIKQYKPVKKWVTLKHALLSAVIGLGKFLPSLPDQLLVALLQSRSTEELHQLSHCYLNNWMLALRAYS